MQQSMQTRFEWVAKQSIYKYLGYFSIHALFLPQWIWIGSHSCCQIQTQVHPSAAAPYQEHQAKSARLLSRTPTL